MSRPVKPNISKSVARAFDVLELFRERQEPMTAAHPLGLKLRPGIGEALWLSAAGRTLLSALPDDASERLLNATIRQERNPKRRREILSMSAILKDIKSTGYYIGYDIYLQGVGAVCVSEVFGQQPAVIAVAGARDRIQSHEKRILRIIRSRLKRLRSA